MKCRSVACLWSESPPLQKVTAAAVLNEPPTLYTGGSDGSIIWWNLSATSDSNQDIRPAAMLCGHAASIADLGICYPVVATRDANNNGSSDLEAAPSTSGALISACTEGVLCIWSRDSGHCRRRRKLPPWVGSPSIFQVLPSNQRYVCIACSSVDTLSIDDRHSVESTEGGESSLESEPHCRKPSKCTVVMVDTCTLTIVQTIFHGYLSIGPMMFMAVVASIEEKEEQVVVLVDSMGKIELVPLSKDSHQAGEAGPGFQKSAPCKDIMILDDGFVDKRKAVSISTSRQILAIVYRTCCIFRQMLDGSIIGEIMFDDGCLCLGGSANQSQVVGGMFLEKHHSQKTCNPFSSKFAVWNDKGSAIVYTVSYIDGVFKHESVCEIPAVVNALDMSLSVCLVKLNSYLLRIESSCIQVEDPFMWRPHITIWSIHQPNNVDGLSQPGKLLGEGSLFVDWISNSGQPLKTGDLKNGLNDALDCDMTKSNPQEISLSDTDYVNSICKHNEKLGFVQQGRVVSSSMVISESFFTPYAVVYGLYNGEIEVVRFDMFFEELHSESGSPHRGVDAHEYKQYFSGHTGAVLCLAAHRVVGISKQGDADHVLISGSADSTIRIWDLDTSKIVTVMHQHVAAVRQIILPPVGTEFPWSGCFLSVGEDCCVALTSLETLRVERMFPGHPAYPAKVVWDGVRGYIACLCQNSSKVITEATDILIIWDIKTGARERVLRGTASHLMFDNFCKGTINSLSGGVLNRNTSVSSLILPIVEGEAFSQSLPEKIGKGANSSSLASIESYANVAIPSQEQASVGKDVNGCSTFLPVLQSNRHPIKSSCSFPGIAYLSFDLASLMSPLKYEFSGNSDEQEYNHFNQHENDVKSLGDVTTNGRPKRHEAVVDSREERTRERALESCLFRFTLSFLHLWDVDIELDNLLINDMKLNRPEKFLVASGLQGDRGSLTLAFPGLTPTLELWKSSSEFGAMRSLMMVSLAQRMINFSHLNTAASSALAAFYTRNFAEKIPAVKPPVLQLLVSFWQDESEHVRMAARSLFHCAASRAIPVPLCRKDETDGENYVVSTVGNGKSEHPSENTEETSTPKLDSELLQDANEVSQIEESNIVAWLESYEVQDWISCVGGTSQDAMTSHIIVAAALAIWYPSLVKPNLAMLVVHPLIKLVMAMNDKYTSTAAELLAEGMESTWKACIDSEIPHLITDIFFQIECLTGASANLPRKNPAVPVTVQETLIDILLPSLAMADISGFLTVVESQIWSTASDSPVHVVSLVTLIRIVRGSPRNLIQYLDKAVNFILQTIDPGNLVMRKTCFQSSMKALKDVARAFPMVALSDTCNRLAVGDAIGDMKNASIRVYDMLSVTLTKVLDASGPPGLPSLLAGTSETMVTTAISALSFSPDGEGLVAFSEHGLMIRWWSLGSAWWEKLSRNLTPVQCTKLIFIPPWEGFSPNSSRSSIMASIMGFDKHANLEENTKSKSDVLQNMDLSYRLEWISERKVSLKRHGQELGSFPL